MNNQVNNNNMKKDNEEDSNNIKPRNKSPKKEKDKFMYYIAFETSHVIDVTPRYCYRWSEILILRKIKIDWINHVLGLPILKRENNNNNNNLGIYNNEKEITLFNDKIMNEPFPDTLVSFQKHHLYCLEKFFNQGQVSDKRLSQYLIKHIKVIL
jgi:hypothetical protein